MEIPGIDTILQRRGSDVWPDEHPAEPKLAQLFDETAHAFEMERYGDAVAPLSKLTGYDQQPGSPEQMARSGLQPSQIMRLYYLNGELFTTRADWRQAISFYEEALSIATQFADLYSCTTLTRCIAQALYGAQAFRDSKAYYESALAIWHRQAAQLSTPSVEPEITLYSDIGRARWLLGEFEDASAALGRAHTLAEYPRGAVSDAHYLHRAHANVLWTLGLTLRAQSDIRDGDIGLLEDSLSHMNTALRLYKDAGTIDYNMGRFYVQIAEVCLDFTELYLNWGMKSNAQSMCSQAVTRANMAANLIAPSRDRSAMLLVKLTQLRHDVMCVSRRRLTRSFHTIDSTLTEIEQELATLTDTTGIAKAATLRGEWLLSLEDYSAARESLGLALKGFEISGMGMATRAQRLLRRIPPSPDPGGQRRPSGGPLPEPLIPPNLDDDDLN